MKRMLLLLLLAGCATPELSLHDRFVATALTNGGIGEQAGEPSQELWRWSWPIRTQIVGSQTYRSQTVAQLEQLSRITGQRLEIDSPNPNMEIEFSQRRGDWYCIVETSGTYSYYESTIFISTDQPDHHVARCITQELSQAMGFRTDTDGRTDTTFSSAIGTDYLTEADLQLFEVLYDQRLYSGMPRDDVLAILPEIVADVEAEQAAQSR